MLDASNLFPTILGIPNSAVFSLKTFSFNCQFYGCHREERRGYYNSIETKQRSKQRDQVNDRGHVSDNVTSWSIELEALVKSSSSVHLSESWIERFS